MSDSKQLFDTTHDATSYGYTNYKDLRFSYITGISIGHFRTLKNRKLKLGKNLTIITGKNGTMKTAILGLIAHPFSSPNKATDLYGNPLKTDHSQIFRLSPEKDKDDYFYYIEGYTIKKEHIIEPVRVYQREDGSKFRVTVGSTNVKGKGNFSLNTSYINLKRLFPIVETDAHTVEIKLSDKEQQNLSRAYQSIMQRDAYNNIDSVSDNKTKNTVAPANSYYDYNSISSGEDNLGHILCKLLAFERSKTDDAELQGIICIDEVEVSLHPSSQIALIDYLLAWSIKNNIQVVCTTHSLHIINHCLQLQSDMSEGFNKLAINNISTQQVGADLNYNIMINPDYKTIYKELTFLDIITPTPYKVNIICEDELGVKVVKKILKKNFFNANLEFLSDITGTKGNTYSGLVSLAKNGKKLLEDSIIVLDPDVSESKTKHINYKYLLQIPSTDTYKFPIEQRVVYYLYNLNGDDQLFSEIEKAAFIQTCTDRGIYIDNYATEGGSADKFKAWRTYNKSLFNKALTRYIKDNEDNFYDFRTTLIERINDRRKAKTLPPLPEN